MDFSLSRTQEQWQAAMAEFLEAEVYPAEPIARAEVAALTPEQRWQRPEVLSRLVEAARGAGLWGLWLPEPYGGGLSHLDFAPVVELSGRSPHLAPEAINANSPDIGNMELLQRFGTDAQRAEWLEPLAAGEFRSSFAMTEPDVASSDAGNIATSIEVDEAAGQVVINGRKWWSSGAMSPDCRVLLVMGKSNPRGQRHQQHSLVIVPMDTPGVQVERAMTVLGFPDACTGGHGEISFTDVRVPLSNVVGDLHRGFGLAQARMAPTRLMHCLKLIGVAERAFDLMAQRVPKRVVFGRPLAQQGLVQQWIAHSRVEIDQARLLGYRAAWSLDHKDDQDSAAAISALKVVAPAMASRVVDRAIQAHGALGLSQDTPLAELNAYARQMHIADGPDEVHMMAVARHELRRYSS
ncbi:acyl-CoA dehydrogenase family protein [Arsenicicoccus sp. oral taxon 190]|uniref:acyl-CoA dehydrogenase family protein n=1 Tax=Arsenicicoccus sp. oral taxon 190 TaxID=1658671 RepID=UPI00067A2AF4|nr:acyl-CoA dehydrogenase family protein [Arsenicicoccus sp. oral taxon 190]AKT52551.1 acyl-CoA dehydrogenase [Arsenicicoccus sp. oral taxon 190]